MKKVFVIILMLLGLVFTTSTTKAVEATSTPAPPASANLYDVSGFENIVIFIRFNDELTYTAPFDFTHYEDLFNGVNMVSLRDYYLEASYNQLTIDSYLVSNNSQFIYYDDIYDRSYYQPYDAVTNPNGYDDTNRDTREHELLKRAIDYVDTNNLVPDTINLDANNDGEIDSITFLVSGEDDGWNSLMWPHKWQLSTYYNYSTSQFTADAPTINGKNAYLYTFELLGNTTYYNYQISVPIVAHETFHLISAPDLYHYYRYTWIDAVGDWGLMDMLTDVPSHMLGYMKYQYGGWINDTDITDITTSGSYTLYPLQDAKTNLFRIDTGYSNEYVYLEYRDHTGTYESNTPSSGLLVYRVDMDYYDNGNENGYYLNDGTTPQDEVFIFRPGIVDTSPPITFASFDAKNIDEDGDINQAALSQYNQYDAMGEGTDVLMFHSDGSLMNIKISNVVEHDGYVTFDVALNDPQVEIVSDVALGPVDDVRLVDVPNSYYSMQLTNVEPNTNIYYTLDGTTPSQSSTLYDGNAIEITATNNHFQAAIYDSGGTLISTMSQVFQFVQTIETPHDNYGNNTHLYWWINLTKLTDYNIQFNDLIYIDAPDDYVRVTDGTNINQYTGTGLANQSLNFVNKELLIEFFSDSINNSYYGISATVNINQTFDSFGYYLNGDATQYIEIGDTFIDPGVLLIGDGSDTGYYQTTSTIDASIPGTYDVTYTIYDSQDQLVGTLVRHVVVEDRVAPTISLIGNSEVHVDVHGSYTDLGVTFTDNYSISQEPVVTGTVDTNTIGEYTISYSVTDDAGNTSAIISRTVYVEDNTDPVASLSPGVDTILVGDDWTDAGITATDNYDQNPTYQVIENTVDTTQTGDYYVVYRAIDSSGNYDQITRRISVVTLPTATAVVCEAGITTYQQNDTIIPLQCSVGNTSLTLDNTSYDMNIIGTQEVLYKATINNEEFSYRTYIFVIAPYSPTLYYDIVRKEGEY